MQIILTILATIVIFLLLIFVHEFGHFAVAKLCHARVDEFSLGMGPCLWQKQHGETMYSLRLLPIGGYCALGGEDEATDLEGDFVSKPWWQKICILVAGAFMNFVLAILLMAIIAFVCGWASDFFSSLYLGARGTLNLGKMMLDALGQLFTGKAGADELSGPVGIVQVISESVSYGIVYVAYVAAIISLNLGIINLLPLPALDGGRVVFVIIRKITGKAITDEMESKVHFVGMALILLLLVFVTFNDVGRIVG
ncbi:MAG: site-2 protease family protein [Firmicutes bacterium]|nr:site-2 protease family protein [Bacillota bacterium]